MEEERLKISKLESLGVLAGGIALDFSNILAAVLTTISLTKTYADPEDEIYKNLTEAEKVCLRAKGLTQQLLTFSKGGAPIKGVTPIRELIKESTDLALMGSNVRGEFYVAEDLWMVEVDEEQIIQVISNVVINADQAMPKGGVVKIRAENVSRNEPEVHSDGLPLKKGRYVKITIEDQGIGIPEDHLTKIFDLYFTTKYKGSGLGLATAYSIIKNHNGYIDVESELGVGTKFYIYIPASDKEIEEKEAAGGRKAVVYGRGRILIMDDEAIVGKSTESALMRIGYEIGYAKDGEGAIEKYIRAKQSDKPFDVVIMDLTIRGGMGGREAIKEVNRNRPRS